MNPDILRNSVYKQKKIGGRFSSSGSRLKQKNFFPYNVLREILILFMSAVMSPGLRRVCGKQASLKSPHTDLYPQSQISQVPFYNSRFVVIEKVTDFEKQS